MHVIDVNSGNRSKGSDAQEKTAIDVNIAAADEIARQLRLRDMGGIIVIDFIDMAEAANRQKLFEHMTKAMANDRAKHNILPLSKFGLMQITRQRVRPAMDVDTSEDCPSCSEQERLSLPSCLPTAWKKNRLLSKQTSREEIHPACTSVCRSVCEQGVVPLEHEVENEVHTWFKSYSQSKSRLS